MIAAQDALQELALMGYIGSDSSNNGGNGRMNGKFNFTKGVSVILPCTCTQSKSWQSIDRQSKAGPAE